MEIEPLSIENLRSLTGLVLELWTECDFEEEFQNYNRILNSEREVCYVVKEDEHYIAFMHLSIRNDYVEGAIELPIAYVEGIYVKPKYQKKGIAKQLMSVAENWARKKGFNQIASDTDLSNSESIYFHQKMGFVEVERVICYIKNI